MTATAQVFRAPPPVLPFVRGKLRPNADIARNTWFQTGGPAEWLFKPEDAEDLGHFLRHKPSGMPVTVIGVGSNLLVRDGGVPGAVVRLGRAFAQVSGVRCRVPEHNSCHSDTRHLTSDTLHVGAACLDVHVAQFACEQGIAGLEFLTGIPGTIGGAVAMNAGAYGRDISQVLVSAEVVDREGNIRTLSAEQLGFTYRHSVLPEGWIVTAATLCGTLGDSEEIATRMRKIQAEREAAQPIRSKTGGSTFMNPVGKKAWELIDAAGCRGLTLGGAKVSDLHCNFLINTGTATAADLENLGEEVRKRVKEKCGVELEWEIKRIGRV